MQQSFETSINHSFDIYLAKEHSIEEAILIHHFLFWVHKNMRMKKNLKEGRTWVYQTLDEIASHYPYMNKDSVHRYIDKLCKKGILLKGNFNKTKFDRTVWYAFNNEEMFTVLRKCKIDMQKCEMDGALTQNPEGRTAISIYDIDAKQMLKEDTKSSSLPSSFKEIDDDDPAVSDNKLKKQIDLEGDIHVTNTRGEKISISQNEIFKSMIRKPFKTSTIKEAIKRTETANSPINNIIKYIESICVQIESNSAKESILEKQEKRKPEISKEPTISWAEGQELLRLEKEEKQKELLKTKE